MPNHFRSQKFTVFVLTLAVLVILIAFGGPPEAIATLAWGVAAALPVVVGGKALEDWGRARAAGQGVPRPTAFGAPSWPVPPPAPPGSPPRVSGGSTFEPTGWGGG